MHAHRARTKEYLCRCACRTHHCRNDLACELIMHYSFAVLVDADTVARRRLVAREYKNHLQSQKRPHQRTVLRTKACQVLCRSEREVHARLEHKPFRLASVHKEALWMPDV